MDDYTKLLSVLSKQSKKISNASNVNQNVCKLVFKFSLALLLHLA